MCLLFLLFSKPFICMCTCSQSDFSPFARKKVSFEIRLAKTNTDTNTPQSQSLTLTLRTRNVNEIGYFSLSSVRVFFFRLQSDLCACRYSRRHLTLCRRVFCLCSWFFFYISFSVIVVCFGTRCTISDIVRAPDRILSRDLCINLVYHHHLVFSEFNPNFVPSIKSRIENEFE